MNKYNVELRPCIWMVKEIEADSPEEAASKMYRMYRNGELVEAPYEEEHKQASLYVQMPDGEWAEIN